jgi:hypothetical protein
MRGFPSLIVFCAVLMSATGPAAYGACNNNGASCPEQSGFTPAMDIEQGANAAQPIQLAELHGGVAPMLTPRAGSGTPAGNKDMKIGSEARPAGAVVLRTQDSRSSGSAVRPSRIERNRAEATVLPEPSVWIMLLAGLAFAGFVVVKRSKGA